MENLHNKSFLVHILAKPITNEYRLYLMEFDAFWIESCVTNINGGAVRADLHKMR
jgi:hypothetical protein